VSINIARLSGRSICRENAETGWNLSVFENANIFGLERQNQFSIPVLRGEENVHDSVSTFSTLSLLL
jgi:hypothetical protein